MKSRHLLNLLWVTLALGAFGLVAGGCGGSQPSARLIPFVMESPEPFCIRDATLKLRDGSYVEARASAGIQEPVCARRVHLLKGPYAYSGEFPVDMESFSFTDMDVSLFDVTANVYREANLSIAASIVESARKVPTPRRISVVVTPKEVRLEIHSTTLGTVVLARNEWTSSPGPKR